MLVYAFIYSLHAKEIVNERKREGEGGGERPISIYKLCMALARSDYYELIVYIY